MFGEVSKRRRRTHRGWISFSIILVTSFSISMQKPWAFSPSSDVRVPEGSITVRTKRRSTVKKLPVEKKRPEVALTDRSRSTPEKIDVRQLLNCHKLRRSIARKARPQELLNLPASSRVVEVGKRNKNSRMIRTRGDSNAARLGAHQAKTSRSDQLLTKEEEYRLTHNVRDLRRVLQVRDELSNNLNPMQPEEDTWAKECNISVLQLRRILFDGNEARKALVAANAGLVTSVAKRYHRVLKQTTEKNGGLGTILSLHDMTQEGNLGLIHAAEKFETERGLRFSTYATYWVRQRILKAIADYSRIIRLPVHVHSNLTKINKARRAMREEIGREPTEPELAHYLSMDVEKLRRYTNSEFNVVSLESRLRPGDSIKNDDTTTLGDVIAADTLTPVEAEEDLRLKQDIRIVMSALTDSERKVVNMRFGLDDGNSLSIAETAQSLGVSRDRVRTMEAKALNKLRNPQKNYRLKNYVESESDDEFFSSQRQEEEPRPPERMWFF